MIPFFDAVWRTHLELSGGLQWQSVKLTKMEAEKYFPYKVGQRLSKLIWVF